MSSEQGRKVLAQNRKARHEYDIEETYDAGLVLTGTEIKSIRAGKANLSDAYATVERGEAWLHHMHVSPYEQGGRFNVEARRTRKLLLHRREINRLIGKVKQKGLTLVPLTLFLQRGYAKVEIGLAKGRQVHDKRQAIAEREQRRDLERALSGRE
ncbi:MAG TPA: SsrA-binding protein SmpB [Armatimonadota bacterium]|jgi:SsrA-binding protein